MLTHIDEERPDSPDAITLITELTETLSLLNYPSESIHGFSVEQLVREGVSFFVTRHEGVPAGCGGIQLFGPEYAEVKRMYVRPQYRGMGLGRLMLDRLSEHALQHGVLVLRLETGIYQHDAIRMYERYGFYRRPPFGAYREDPHSIYFEKQIRSSTS